MSLKDVMIIEYPHQWGGCFADNKFWCGTINDEVEDWSTKEDLIKQAEEMKIPWIIYKNHRDGTKSIIKCSSSFKLEEKKDGT